MVKYAPRKVYIRESGGYVELSYTEFCRCRESDQTYMDKLFIPIQGCLLEVVREQYTDFYRDKERWRYLQKLDTKNRLLSLDGFTDSEGNPLDFIEYLTRWGPGLLRLGAIMSFGGYCVSRPGLLRLGAVVG